jgi:hypothetical protein
MTPFCEGSVRDKNQSITLQKSINQQVIKISEGVRDEKIFLTLRNRRIDLSDKIIFIYLHKQKKIF